MWRWQLVESVGHWEDKKMHQPQGPHSKHIGLQICGQRARQHHLLGKQGLHSAEVGPAGGRLCDGFWAACMRTHIHSRQCKKLSYLRLIALWSLTRLAACCSTTTIFNWSRVSGSTSRKLGQSMAAAMMTSSSLAPLTATSAFSRKRATRPRTTTNTTRNSMTRWCMPHS